MLNQNALNRKDQSERLMERLIERTRSKGLLCLELVSAGVYPFYVFRCQREGSADGWPALVYFAAFFFGIVRNAAFAAFAASHASSASFGLPPFHKVSFKIPNNSSPDPSIEHGREYVVSYISARISARENSPHFHWGDVQACLHTICWTIYFYKYTP